MRLAITLGVLFAIVLGGAEVARAQGTEAEVKKYYEDGKTAYNMGEFEDAVAKWKEGYAKTKNPVFLFNMGQAYRQLENYNKAIFFYKAFLRETSPDDPNRATVEKRVEEMKKLVEAKKGVADAPPDGPAEVEPGPVEDRPPVEEEQAQPEAVAPPPRDEAPPSAGGGLRITGIITGVAGLGLVATGVVFGLKVGTIEDEIADARAMGATWNEDLMAKEDDARSAATISTITLVAGGALVVTGGVLYWLGASKKAEARRVSVVPVVGPETTGAAVWVSF